MAIDLRERGVYRIVNLLNGRRYIGSTVQSFRKRFRNHLFDLRRGSHHCQPLQRAWDKYGADAFAFEPICVTTVDAALQQEQALIDALRPEYNVAPLAGSPFGVRHTEQARRNMSAAQRKLLSDPGYVAKRAQGIRDGWALPGEKERRTAIQNRPDVVAKRSASSKEVWSRPGFKERSIQAMKEANARPEIKARKSQAVSRRGRDKSPVTPEVASAIRQALQAGVRGSDLARTYGIGQTTVSRIKHGDHWGL